MKPLLGCSAHALASDTVFIFTHISSLLLQSLFPPLPLISACQFRDYWHCRWVWGSVPVLQAGLPQCEDL